MGRVLIVQVTTTKRSINLILFSGIILLCSVVSLIAANTAFMVTDKIYNGVSVGDILVGGLSIQEAQNKIAVALQTKTVRPPLILAYHDQTWPITAQDIELAIDNVNLAQQAYNVGRNGNIMHRLQERYLAIHHGYTIPLLLSYNQDKLAAIIKNIAYSIDKKAQNAVLVQNDANIRVIPEIVGQKVDDTTTLNEIISKIKVDIPVTVPLAVSEVLPAIVSKDLADIDRVIAIYTTQFDPGNQNRVQNVTLAAKSINNILVKPEEVLSFNAYVGLRLAEYGYKEAPVFIEGKLVPDWGGGVCQVSSTLYNAVLLADMGIVERTSHFRPPGYVPLGQDATVADNLLDFKFKNTSPYNIYINSEVSDSQVTIYVLGKRSPNPLDIHIVTTEKKIIEPNTIIKQDPTLELGSEIVEVEGQRGFQVTTYRVRENQGREIDREFLAFDEFKQEDRVLRVGTKVPVQQVK
jgi:vancomycin resistance protein YoaR